MEELNQKFEELKEEARGVANGLVDFAQEQGVDGLLDELGRFLGDDVATKRASMEAWRVSVV